ncbi:MAG: TetR/AcrR family transcriptional regulator [Clostridium sp.]|uniref:TetR/AcrR family transcriptional regulator n=1 Tax=Clostridium sp. TaxID=1506 RepID=UPI0039ED6D0D
MGTKERKEREKDEHRELILNAASEIMEKEGLEKLSIRKIAVKIEYSPAIIYHYFKDKEEIINIIMQKSYEKILDVLSSSEISNYTPENKIRHSLHKYIYLALEMPEEYRTILLNNSPRVREHTSVLFKGASIKRKALGILYQSLKDIYMDKNIEDNVIELTAQIIWTSTFGLILKLIVEKDTPEEQQKLLIDHHINLIVDGIILRKPLTSYVNSNS